jgi:hypothetical protein
MNFDFALILVLATLVTGLGWLVDKLFFEPSRRKKIATAVLFQKMRKKNVLLCRGGQTFRGPCFLFWRWC